MSSIPQKRCTKCGAEKPLNDFTVSRIHRDGHYPSCKACKNAQSAEYRAANLEKVRERARRSQAERADKHRADGKRYYAANRDRVKTRTTQYRKEHPEMQRKAKQK